MQDENVCRIISARKATRHEQEQYFQGRPLHTRDNLPLAKTDWARLDAMTDEEVMAAALADPDA
jgi:hypothetical protein